VSNILVGAMRAELSGASASFEAALSRSAATVDRTAKRIERSGRRLNALGQGIQAVGMSLTLGLTVPLTAMGVHAAKTFGDFEQGMNRVRALSGATGDSFAALENQAKELGRTTQFTATQAADGMGFLAMAGFKANEILRTMPGVLQLAASAQLDVARAADITSNVLSGYGMAVEEVGRSNDVLTKAFTSANTDLEQLGQAFKFAGPVAKAAGVEFEETAAVLALMGKAGIQASMAGTSLRNAISRLLNPTKQVQEELDRLGVTAKDSHGRLLPLDQIIQQLEPHAADAGAMMKIFGQRAGPALVRLVAEGSAAVSDLTQKLRDSGGTAETVAAIQMEGLKGSFIAMSSAAEGMAVEVGAVLAPALTLVANGFRTAAKFAAEDLVPAFRELPQAGQIAAGGLLAVAAAAGPLAVATGMVISGVGQTVVVLGQLGVISRVTSAWTAASAAMFAAGNTSAALSLRLAFLAGQTAAAAVGTKLYTAATGLLVVAKGALVGALTAVSARLGVTTVATATAAAGTKVLTVAVGGLTVAARGLAVTMGFLGKAVAVVAVAYGSWKIGRWIGEVTGLEDALSGLIARMMGASEEAIAFEREHNRAKRAAENAGEAVDQEAAALAALKEQLGNASASVEQLDQAMEELAAAGELDAVAMRRVGQQAKVLADEGVQLTAGLQNVVDWYERTQAAGDELGGSTDELGKKVQTLAERFKSLVSQSNTAQLRAEWERTTLAMREFDEARDELDSGHAGLFGPEAVPQIEAIGAGLRTSQLELAEWGHRALEGGAALEPVLEQLKAMGADQELLNFLTEKYGGVAGEAAQQTESWSQIVQDLANTVGAMGGRWGNLLGTITGGIAGIGSAVDRINLGADRGGGLGGILGGFFGGGGGGLSGILKNLNAGMQIASVAFGVGKALHGLFTSSPVERAAEDAGKALGVTVSDALAEQIAEDAERLGDGVAAALVNLPDAIEEAGGVAEFGFDQAVSSARDLFSQIETGKLSVREAGEAFDEVFGMLLPEALDDATGLASASFLELIELNERFGTESAAVADFVKGQLQNTLGGLKAFLDNAIVSTEAGAAGLSGAIVAAFDELLAQGVPAAEAVERIGPLVDQLRQQLIDAGLEGSAAFAALEAQVAVYSHEIQGPAIEAVLGLGRAMVGLHNMGLLNQETFAGLAAEAGATFAALQEQGLATPEALGAMQPTLQQIWQLQRDFGYEVDESTQALLDEAEAAGLVGDAQRDAQDRAAEAMERTAEILEALAVHMGVTLPDSARRGARGIEDAFRGIHLEPIDVRYNDPGPRGGGGGHGNPDVEGRNFAIGGADDFGAGQAHTLHGPEVIAPADRESAIVDQLAARISSKMGDAGAGAGSEHRFEVGLPMLNAFFEVLFSASQTGQLRIHRAAVVEGS
jgi:TP901 family phage tail tape measure protein